LNNHYFKYNGEKIFYTIERKDVKAVNLRVTPDLKVVVSANSTVEKESLEDFVKSKSNWIYKRLKEFKETQSFDIEKKFISGESIRYLGKQYMLKVKEDDANIVKYYQGKIFMCVEDKKNYELKKKIYKQWQKEKAEEVFKEVLNEMYERVKIYGVNKPALSIRDMRTRWGSCNNEKEKIIINKQLIMAKKTAIKYVILHELIHLMHPNHSKEFYNMLGTLMPDYEKRKEYLDEKIIKEL